MKAGFTILDVNDGQKITVVDLQSVADSELDFFIAQRLAPIQYHSTRYRESGRAIHALTVFWDFQRLCIERSGDVCSVGRKAGNDADKRGQDQQGWQQDRLSRFEVPQLDDDSCLSLDEIG